VRADHPIVEMLQRDRERAGEPRLGAETATEDGFYAFKWLRLLSMPKRRIAGEAKLLEAVQKPLLILEALAPHTPRARPVRRTRGGCVRYLELPP